jgi:hypothetical protein
VKEVNPQEDPAVWKLQDFSGRETHALEGVGWMGLTENSSYISDHCWSQVGDHSVPLLGSRM